MSVAIILAGRFRGDDKMISIHNENIGKYDTYVSCLNKYQSEWENSSWDIKNLYVTPEIQFKETKWAEYRDDGAGQAGFWQFWNLKGVIDNVPQYNWYIKSRNDLLFPTKLNIDFQTLDKNIFYCPNVYFDGQVWDKDELLNDQFYIVSSDVLKVIGNFVENFYKELAHEKNTSLASNERCLRAWLKHNNIEVKGFDFPYIKNHNGQGRPSGFYQFELE